MIQRTILVVEDDPFNLEFLEDILQAHGYEVLRATDGVAALDAVGRCQPDLVLLDIQISGLSGEEVARYLKANPATQRIPLVAVTAYAMAGDRDRILAAGCDAYISKPVDAQSLLGEVQRHLRPGDFSSGP